jgi:hypothetical protein
VALDRTAPFSIENSATLSACGTTCGRVAARASSSPARAASAEVVPGADSSRWRRRRDERFAAGSADSNTTRPCGPSSASIQIGERRAPCPCRAPRGAQIGQHAGAVLRLLQHAGQFVDGPLDALRPA